MKPARLLPHPRRRPFRRVLPRVLLAIGLVSALLPAAVLAVDIPRLTGTVTDQTGALAGTSGTTGPAIDRLKRTNNVDLWVLFVPTTGTSSVTAFADDVARLNSLGVNDVLLLVALTDRTDALWVSDGVHISNSQIDQILSTRVEPKLAAGDPAGAVVGAADGIAAVVGTAASPGTTAAPTVAARTPGATTSGTGTPTSSSGGGGGLLPLLLIIVVLIGAWVVYRRIRPARIAVPTSSAATGTVAGTPGTGTAPGGAPTTVSMSPQELERHANQLLIETDEAVRDATQELGFVEAQFGAAEAANLRPGVDQASTEMHAAFVARQQLDDSVPDDRDTRNRLLAEIVQHCDRAHALLADQKTRVAALRDVEKTAPDLIASLPGQLAAARGRLGTASTTMSSLSAYAPSTWQSIAGNVPEAQKRLDFADAALAQASTTLASGDRGTTAGTLRQVQTALAEAATLFDAVDRLAASLADVRGRLPAELAAAEADVESARTAIAATTPSAETAAKFADAQRLLADAKAAATAPTPDVFDAYKKATDANAAADTVVAAAGIEQDRAAQRRQVLDLATLAASLSITRASDYVATRRGALGTTSRTRLSEAERQLQASHDLAGSNADEAIASAQRAERFADESLQLAAQEFDAFERAAPAMNADGFGTPDAAGSGGAAASGGRSAGGGWGGTGWGTRTPTGGFPGGVGEGWGGLRGHSRGGRW